MKVNKQKNLKQGFTLLELLVVVLIIGILASIALPQYQMAVTKAKVASILPLMRRFKDAMAEYKLQHGDYDIGDTSALGVNWPSDWKKGYESNDPCGDSTACRNDYWDVCIVTDIGAGDVYCEHSTSDGIFLIRMYQPDDPYFENFRDKITCFAHGDEAHKVCKALGGKLLKDYENGDLEYQLY